MQLRALAAHCLAIAPTMLNRETKRPTGERERWPIGVKALQATSAPQAGITVPLGVNQL